MRRLLAVIVVTLVIGLSVPGVSFAKGEPETIRSTTVGGPVKPAPDARTVPFFQGGFVDRGVTYPYSMVGPGRVTVTIVPLRVVLADGTVFDATSSAGDLLKSPVFTAATFDTGTTQYVDAIRRAEFAGTASDRSLTLTPNLRPTVEIQVPSGAGSAGTTFFGAPTAYVSLPWLDARIRDLTKSLEVSSSSLALFLTLDLLLVDGRGCCVGGYHGVTTGAAHGAGVQSISTYALANWYSPGGFLFSDTTVASHEIAEWADDPFESNAVPPWISPLPIARAVYGCYRYLETADPALDIEFSVDGEHHLQDITFLSWFAHEEPSTAFGGRYTYTNAFDQPAERC